MALFQNGLNTVPSHAAKQTAQVRAVANRAWTEMQERGILPTPANFELWYAHATGNNPALSDKLAALLQGGAVPTAEQLQVLHASCTGPEPDVEAFADNAEQLDKAAQTMVEHVASNQEALRAYGDALSGMATKLGQDASVDSLLRAVTVLSSETANASARNRVLEQKLSSSSARIAKLRQNLAEAKQDATTDGLTGLCNRKAFDLRLRRAMVRAKTENDPFALLLLDIDDFKRFNDTYGHRTGDLVLRLVGRVVLDNVKGRDTAARYGGEEFAVILTGADLRAGTVVAGQMRAALDGKRLITKTAHSSGSVTISAGVAQYRPGDTASTLVERADAALYTAKHRGRNRVCTEDQTALQPAL